MTDEELQRVADRLGEKMSDLKAMHFVSLCTRPFREVDLTALKTYPIHWLSRLAAIPDDEIKKIYAEGDGHSVLAARLGVSRNEIKNAMFARLYGLSRLTYSKRCTTGRIYNAVDTQPIKTQDTQRRAVGLLATKTGRLAIDGLRSARWKNFVVRP